MIDSILLDIAATFGDNYAQQLFLMVGMLVVFYFFMIRPQQKRKKDQKTFWEKAKKGAPAITIGGIHGKVYEVGEDTITLEIDNKGSKITMEKSAISLEATMQYVKKRATS